MLWWDGDSLILDFNNNGVVCGSRRVVPAAVGHFDSRYTQISPSLFHLLFPLNLFFGFAWSSNVVFHPLGSLSLEH